MVSKWCIREWVKSAALASDLRLKTFNRVITDISVVIRKTTDTISDSIETGSSVESEIVRVVFPCATEITGIARVKKNRHLQGLNTLKLTVEPHMSKV